MKQYRLEHVHPLQFGQTYCTLSGERWTVTYAKSFPVFAVNPNGETRAFAFEGSWVRFPRLPGLLSLLIELFLRSDKSKHLVCTVCQYPELARRMKGEA
jgi:hypothetical protein